MIASDVRMCRSSGQGQQSTLGAAAHTKIAVDPYCPVVGRLGSGKTFERKAEYEWQETQFYIYPIMGRAAVR
jgi:hypothetical protein